MRPMAWVAVALAAVVVLLVVALVRERRRGARDVAEWIVHYQGVLERVREIYLAEIDRAHEEMHKALDRLQAPEWAVQDSQSERAIKQGAIDPGITGPTAELPLSGEMRERQEQLEAELARKLAERGVDPSELQSASAEYRGVEP